jgi:hypothetical protein
MVKQLEMTVTAEPLVPMVDTAEEHTDSLLSVIGRAASDPRVDVEKMRALLDMKERVDKETARRGWHEAMARLQPKLPRITKTGAILTNTGAVRSTYAKLEDVDAAIRPLYTAEGFSVFFTTELREKMLLVTCHVSRSGHSETTTMPIPIDPGAHGNNAAQGMGITMSYGKRYAISAAFNIITVDEDRDADQSNTEPITEGQRNQLMDLVISTGANESGFLKYMKVSRYEEITQANFQVAMNALKQKASRK